MTRCVACDRPLKQNEFFWRKDEKRWEDMCAKCRSAVFKADQENSDDPFGMDFDIKFQIEEGDDFGGGDGFI